jgi:hypothetical protein
MVPLWVYRSPEVTPTILSLYVALSMYGWDAGRSMSALIEATGIGKSTVYAGVQVLIKVGAVVKQPNGRLFVPKARGELPDSSVLEKRRSKGVRTAPRSPSPSDSGTLENRAPDSGTLERDSTTMENPSGTLERASLIDLKRSRNSEGDFDRFWNVYPLHLDRKIAETAWAKATKRPEADPELLISAALTYANDPNRDDAYTKRASTWLNGECWANDPLPPKASNGNGARAEPKGFDAIRRAAARRGLLPQPTGGNDDRFGSAVPAESRELRMAAGGADG